GFSPGEQAGAVAAAYGTGISNVTADETIGVLAGFAARGGSALQVAAGAAVAGLVQGGAISGSSAAADLFQSSLVSNVTTVAQLNNVVVGLLAGGSTAMAGALGINLVSNGLIEAIPAVAPVASAAVAA